MMVVTHEMGFARKVANRVIFMDEGRIVEDCTKEEFFGTPRSERANISCRRFCIRAHSTSVNRRGHGFLVQTPPGRSGGSGEIPGYLSSTHIRRHWPRLAGCRMRIPERISTIPSVVMSNRAATHREWLSTSPSSSEPWPSTGASRPPQPQSGSQLPRRRCRVAVRGRLIGVTCPIMISRWCTPTLVQPPPP